MADDAAGQHNHNSISRNYSLESIFKAAVQLNLPVAIWRLPETIDVQACISFDAAIQVEQPELEQSQAGFLFCPFMASTDFPNHFIKAELTYSASTGEIKVTGKPAQDKLSNFFSLLNTIDDTSPSAWHLPLIANPPIEQDKQTYIATVDVGIEAIQQGCMEKVVLSRSKTEDLPINFNSVTAFKEMADAYPRAFASLVSIPGTGTWLGASPEILVSIDQQQVFRTVALAGTQPASENTSLANAIWRQKEIEEQGMVERYILSCFKKLRLREYSEVGPRTIVAGNLMHLRTDFKVDLSEVDFPTLGTDMLQLLHPTSAICGLPKEPALEFIKQHEGYNRSYYAGFLGPVKSREGTHIFVNLRCMQLLSTKAVLYAGAGITAESSAEKEYQETQHKMQTMRCILANFE